MGFHLSVLGSGSSGNSTLLRFGEGGARRGVLVDAGLSPRQTARRLEPFDAGLDDVGAVLLTHLDNDHFHRGWLKIIERTALPVHVHRRHRHAAVRRGIPVRHLRVFEGGFEPMEGVAANGVLLAHDQLGTVGYRIEAAGRSLGFATDLGRVPSALLRHFDGVGVLALESNYDRRMQIESQRPEFLRRRIMGGAGHLSNEQALDAIMRIDRSCPLAGVILLHVSRECNDPRVIRRLYSERAPHLLRQLTISEQHRPTPLLHVAARHARGEQLMLL
ncbi:MAG: MBL fold metallo-hydrolase [Planctomycetota bacterium]